MSTEPDDCGCPVAHDNPDQLPEYGVWLCCCQGCAVALHALALAQPGTPIVLKSGMDRKIVSALEAAHVRAAGDFEMLLDRADDYLREVFVGPGPDVDVNIVDYPALPALAEWAPCPECAADEES